MRVMKKILILLYLFCILSGNKIFGQNLGGFTEVCPDTVYQYNAFGVCKDGWWWTGPSGGETIELTVDGRKNHISWYEEPGTHQIGLRVASDPSNCPNKLPSPIIITKSVSLLSLLTPKSDTISSSTNILKEKIDDYPPTSIAICEGLTYWLKTERVKENITANAGQLRYHWYYTQDDIANNNWTKLTTGTSNITGIQLDTVTPALDPGKNISFKVEVWSVCESNKKFGLSNAIALKDCFENYGLTTIITNPTCFNSNDATIVLDSIPDPSQCSAYDPTKPVHDSISLSITRLVEMVGGQCYNTPAGGGATTDDGYCRTGYTANYKFKYTSPNELIKDIMIIDDKNPNGNDTIKGIAEGIYRITIENDIFTPHVFYSDTVKAPDTLKFKSAFANTYYYDNIPRGNIPVIGGGTDTIKLEIEGGNPGDYGYEIYNGANVQVYSGTAAKNSPSDTAFYAGGIPEGSYYVKVKDSKMCFSLQDSNTVVLTEPLPLVIDSVLYNPVDCHTDNTGNSTNGLAQVFINNGIGPYSLYYGAIEYDDVNTASIEHVYKLEVDSLRAGNYNFTVRDRFGNTSSGSIANITQPPYLYFTLDSTYSPKCIGGLDGKAFVTGHGGNNDFYNAGNYTFEPFPKTTIDDSIVEFSNLDTIQYITYIEDSRNCGYTGNIKVAPNPGYVRINYIDSAEITCKDYDDGWVEFGGLKGDTLPGIGYTFYIDNMDTPHGTGNSIKIENLTPGEHTLAIADDNDCMNPMATSDKDFYKRQIWVEEPDTIKVSKEIQNVKIKGTNTGKITFTIGGANGEFEYKFLNNQSKDTLEAGITNDTIIIDSLYANDYELLVKDNIHACTNGESDWYTVNQIKITEPEKFLGILIDNSDTIVSCFGNNDGFVIISGDGGCDENFTYGSEKSNITLNNGEFPGLGAGEHTFYVKDNCGIIDSITVTIYQPVPLSASISSVTGLSCFNSFDGIVNLHITGGTKPYYYSTDNGITTIQDTIIYDLPAGNYNILVSDAGNCTFNVNATVTRPAELIIDSVAITGTLCSKSNGSVQAYVSGGTAPYTYQWKNESGTIVSNSSLTENLSSGNYSLYVTDANLCDTTRTSIVTNTDGPIISVTGTSPASCSGYSDGKVYFNADNSRGVQPFTLDLYYNNGSTPALSINNQAIGNDSITGLSDGEYLLKLTDANNCISVASFEITTPEPLSIVPDELNNPVCYGYSDGSISINAIGANGNYNYLWNTGATGSGISNLAAGTYHITVSDSKGCNAETEYELTNPEQLRIDLGEDKTICEGQNYTLSPGEFQNYTWKYGTEIIGTESQVTVNSRGQYSVLVESNEGCFASDTFNLTVSTDLLEAEFLMPSEAFVSDTVVIIDITWPEPEEIFWDFDQSIIRIHSEQYLEEIAFNAPGIYNVKLTSVMAICIDSISKQITVKEVPEENPEEAKLGAESIIKKFNVYPNPNTGHFYADIELSEKTDIELRVFNMQQNSFTLIDKYYNSDKYLIDYGFTNINTGVYLVILYVKNEKKTKRVLIAK